MAGRLNTNLNSPRLALAMMLLALTQVPVAIKTAAEIACIGEVSHKTWRESGRHQGVNVVAVKTCNGAP